MCCYNKNLADKDNLQRKIGNFVDWTKRWQVSLNFKKCKIISIHHIRYLNMELVPNYDINNILLEHVNEINIWVSASIHD